MGNGSGDKKGAPKSPPNRGFVLFKNGEFSLSVGVEQKNATGENFSTELVEKLEVSFDPESLSNYTGDLWQQQTDGRDFSLTNLIAIGVADGIDRDDPRLLPENLFPDIYEFFPTTLRLELASRPGEFIEIPVTAEWDAWHVDYAFIDRYSSDRDTISYHFKITEETLVEQLSKLGYVEEAQRILETNSESSPNITHTSFNVQMPIVTYVDRRGAPRAQLSAVGQFDLTKNFNDQSGINTRFGGRLTWFTNRTYYEEDRSALYAQVDYGRTLVNSLWDQGPRDKQLNYELGLNTPIGDNLKAGASAFWEKPYYGVNLNLDYAVNENITISGYATYTGSSRSTVSSTNYNENSLSDQITISAIIDRNAYKDYLEDIGGFSNYSAMFTNPSLVTGIGVGAGSDETPYSVLENYAHLDGTSRTQTSFSENLGNTRTSPITFGVSVTANLSGLLHKNKPCIPSF